MTDRELMELAAKAQGGLVFVPDLGWIHEYADGNRGSWWAPLKDDGDALRLAVSLGIQIHFEGGEADDAVWANEVMLWTNGDRLAATRRVIVRCAAEIGRKMQ